MTFWSGITSTQVVLASLFLVLVVLVAAIVVDVRYNPNDRTLRFRLRRVVNWLSLGLGYNCFYTARYAMTVINVPFVRARLGATHCEYGLVLTCGFWSYALFTLLNGHWLDSIGGRAGMLVGASGGIVFCAMIYLFFASGYT